MNPISCKPYPMQEASQTDVPGAITHSLPGSRSVLGYELLCVSDQAHGPVHKFLFLRPFEVKLLGDMLGTDS